MHSGKGKIIRKVDDDSERYFVFFPKKYKYHGDINVICYKNEFIYQIDNHNSYLFLVVISIITYFLISITQSDKNQKGKIIKIGNQIFAFVIFLYHFVFSFNVSNDELFLFSAHCFIEKSYF